MYVNSTGNMTKAREIAQANADWTGEPWVIFTDCSGNVRVERQSGMPHDVTEIVAPQPSPKEPENV